MEDDAAYYAARATAERKRAATASDPQAAAVHETLARKYEALAAQVKAKLAGNEGQFGEPSTDSDR